MSAIDETVDATAYYLLGLEAVEPAGLLNDESDVFVRIAVNAIPGAWPVVELLGRYEALRDYVEQHWDEETFRLSAPALRRMTLVE